MSKVDPTLITSPDVGAVIASAINIHDQFCSDFQRLYFEPEL
jgi:hypothetical protein